MTSLAVHSALISCRGLKLKSGDGAVTCVNPAPERPLSLSSLVHTLSSQPPRAYSSDQKTWTSPSSLSSSGLWGGKENLQFVDKQITFFLYTIHLSSLWCLFQRFPFFISPIDLCEGFYGIFILKTCENVLCVKGNLFSDLSFRSICSSSLAFTPLQELSHQRNQKQLLTILKVMNCKCLWLLLAVR